ncbi:hypothetical protein Tco_0281946 [Tanacetum coccineum]
MNESVALISFGFAIRYEHINNLTKKLQASKIVIKQWTKNAKKSSYKVKIFIQSKPSDIDKILDQGGSNEEILADRSLLLKELNDINSIESLEAAQKSKVRWTIEGDKNTKFFHGILNSKCSQLAIYGTLVNGEWIIDPLAMKSVFLKYFSTQFSSPVSIHICFVDQFTNRSVKALEIDWKKLSNGVDGPERKMAWISWNKVLASKKYGGLGVFSFYALNRALLFKWVWRFFSWFLSMDEIHKSYYCEESALNSPSSLSKYSSWLDIIREMTTSVGNNSVFRSFFEKQKLTGPNFIDWYRQLRLVLSTEDKEKYLEEPIPAAPVAAAPDQPIFPQAQATYNEWVKNQKEIVVMMLLTMDLEI